MKRKLRSKAGGAAAVIAVMAVPTLLSAQGNYPDASGNWSEQGPHEKMRQPPAPPPGSAEDEQREPGAEARGARGPIRGDEQQTMRRDQPSADATYEAFLEWQKQGTESP